VADTVDPESFGPLVEFTPADQTVERSIPSLDVAALAVLEPSAEAQEIVLSPPGSKHGAEPLHLFFETGAENFPRALAEATESLYVIFGRSVLEALRAALHESTAEIGVGFGYSVHAPAALQGEKSYRGPQETPKRHKLITTYPSVVSDLAARINDSLAKTAPAVTAWSIDFLKEQRTHVVDQSFRYLLTAANEQRGDAHSRRAAIERHLSSTPFGLEISGPDAPGLVRALRDVRPARDALEKHRYDAAFLQVERRAILAGLVLLHPDPVGAALRLQDIPVTTPAEDRAAVDVRVRVAADIERIATDHPLIHRLWTTDAVDLVQRAEASYPRATNEELAARLSTASAYRRAVGAALDDTLSACSGMIEELADPDAIWSYPVAVRRALKDQGVARGSLVVAAANEQLQRVAGPSLIARINDLVGHLQMVALAGGITAPEAVLLELASLALTVLEMVEQAWSDWHASRAAKTHLNPGMSLAAQPSYIGILLAILGVGANALGLRSPKP